MTLPREVLCQLYVSLSAQDRRTIAHVDSRLSRQHDAETSLPRQVPADGRRLRLPSGPGRRPDCNAGVLDDSSDLDRLPLADRPFLGPQVIGPDQRDEDGLVPCVVTRDNTRR